METDSKENAVLEKPATSQLASVGPEDRHDSPENSHGFLLFEICGYVAPLPPSSKSLIWNSRSCRESRSQVTPQSFTIRILRDRVVGKPEAIKRRRSVRTRL